MTDRPPFSIPTMTDIRSTPWNGLTVISTFSGAGGSSLGYRMAGFTVPVVCEFVPAAADVYRLNAQPGTIIVEDDLRDVPGADLLAHAGLNIGELDVLDGSPPCASFSTAGRGSKGWGQVRSYSDRQQRVDDLFYVYARLVREMQPRVFVAENVTGLVRGESKGYFKRIHQELADCGYRVNAWLLDSQWLGVPQRRRRVMFVGVRTDLPFSIDPPTPNPYRYGVSDACPHLTGTVIVNKTFLWQYKGYRDTPASEPSYTVTANGLGPCVRSQVFVVGDDIDEGLLDPETGDPLAPRQGLFPDKMRGWFPGKGMRQLSIPEVRRISSFPDDFELSGATNQRWERLGRAVPPLMMRAVATQVADRLCAA